MNIKILSLASICLVFTFCTSPPQQKIWVTGSEKIEVTGSIPNSSIAGSKLTIKSILIEDRSFNEVWNTCEKVLIHLEYHFYKSDKTAGEFLVRSAGPITPVGSITEGQTIQGEEYLILLISLSQSTGKISVTCLVWGSGIAKVDAARMERRELDRFLEALQKDLKK